MINYRIIMAKKKSKKRKKKSQVLKKVGILSLGKISGLFGVIYGLVSGLLMAIIFSMDNSTQVTAQFGILSSLGPWAIIVMPILNGILYFLTGIVVAFIYNLLANRVGGIELNLE